MNTGVLSHKLRNCTHCGKFIANYLSFLLEYTFDSPTLSSPVQWIVLPSTCDGIYLYKYMSCLRFDEILASFRYMSREVHYEDGFLHMRHVEQAWNKTITDEFNPFWINLLIKSMVEWFNKPSLTGSSETSRSEERRKL